MDPNQQIPHFSPPPGQAKGPTTPVQHYGQPLVAGQPVPGQSTPGEAAYGHAACGQSTSYGQPGQPGSGQQPLQHLTYGQQTYGQSAFVQPSVGHAAFRHSVAEQPVHGQPAYNQPASPQPAYGQPAHIEQPGQPAYYGHSTAGQQVSGQTVHGQPTYSQPGHGQPVYGQPALVQPGYGQAAAHVEQPGQPVHHGHSTTGQPAAGQSVVGYPAAGHQAQSVPPQGATTPTWGREGSYTSPAALVAAANQTWGPPPTRKNMPSVYEQQQMKRQPQALASRPTSLRGLYSNLKNEARAVAASLAAQRVPQYQPQVPGAPGIPGAPGAPVVEQQPPVYAQVPIPQSHYYNAATAPPPVVPQPAAYTQTGIQDHHQYYGSSAATPPSIARKPLATHASMDPGAPVTAAPVQQQYQYQGSAGVPSTQYSTLPMQTISYQQPAPVPHHEPQHQNRVSIYGQPQQYSQVGQADLPQTQTISPAEQPVTHSSPVVPAPAVSHTVAYMPAAAPLPAHGSPAAPDTPTPQAQPHTVPPVQSHYAHQEAAQNSAVQHVPGFQDQTQYQQPAATDMAPSTLQAYQLPPSEPRTDPNGDPHHSQAPAPAMSPNPQQPRPEGFEASPALAARAEVSQSVSEAGIAQREAQEPQFPQTQLPQSPSVDPPTNTAGILAPQPNLYFAAPPLIPPKTPDKVEAAPQVMDTRVVTGQNHAQQLIPTQPVHAQAGIEHGSSDIMDQIQSLVTSMDHVSIAQPGGVGPMAGNPWLENDWCRPPLKISHDGEPNKVVWDCPGSVRDVTYEADWFHLADVPDFLICTRCHDRFLKQTSLAPSFNKIRRANGRCRFNVPRITSVLLPQCLQLQTVSPLQEYMVKRLGMKDCKEATGVAARDGFKWFIIKGDTNDVMINFVSCQACYEDIVLASRYAGEFMPREDRYSHTQPDTVTWYCDLHFPYIKRSFKIYSRNNAPFADWVTKATRNFQIPDCEGAVVESSSREWVRIRGLEKLVICEKCYFNQIAWTAIEKDFEYIPIKKPVRGSEWMDKALGYREEEPTAWQCHGKGWPMRSAIEAAVKRQDIGIFLRAAEKIMACPPCHDNGISNGTWYTLKGGCDGYEICPACLAGFCEAFDSGQFFEIGPRSGAPEALRCNLNPKAPRYLQFILSLNEAQQEGVWSRYANTVRKFIDLPECPKDEHVPSRKWYGWHECLICPDCYQAVCKDTRGELRFELENEVIDEIRMCSLYSPRMREKWALACQKGDATELVEFSSQRTQVWARTVPYIKMLRQQQELQMMTAMSAGFAGLMFQGAQSMQTISGSTDGYLHGNSSLGYHETENGVASAQKFNEMHSGFNAANSGGTWGQIFQLAAEWDKWQ